MIEPQPVFVHGRCACGQRYRLRNPAAGVTVQCPHCGRPITVTADDLRAAAEPRLIPLEHEAAPPQDAIPLEPGRLPLAPSGSEPGLSGRVAADHEEAMLAHALSRWTRLNSPDDEPLSSRGRTWAPGLASRRRGFLLDLLASFYLPMLPRNLLSVAATTLVAWVLLTCVVFGIRVISILAWLVAAGYVVQFLWTVLGETENGEDEIPLFQADWSWWDDAIKPTLWLVAISFACSLPVLCGATFISATAPAKPMALIVLLALGWFFWPVAVLAVSLGNTLSFLRPDWLVRCVIGVGPLYLVFWAMTLMAIAVWVGYGYWMARLSLPLLGWVGLTLPGTFVDIYVGYVLFRNIGLLFRHFRNRLPWRF